MPHTGQVNVTFDWRALPRNIPIITSFGVIRGNERHRVIHGRAPWTQILTGLLAGGNFRLSESRFDGTTVILAARGTWKFSDAEVLKDVRRIIDEENRFWHARPMPFFLVTLAAFDERFGDNDGSGFTNAYMLFLSHEDTMDAERLQLMAHEMFHHWNPLSMGSRGAGEVAQWFTEGFTVYYAGVPDGPAYNAGIRDGQELFRWSVYNDDPSKDAVLGVVIDGQRKMITFSPIRQAQVEQYRAIAEGEALSTCTPF
jgi:hypothetical protein